MSLLLPILYVTATTLLLAWLTGVAIEHRDGLPGAGWLIASLACAFIASLLSLVQLCRAADWIDRVEHAQTAAPAVGISRTVPGLHVARKPRQMVPGAIRVADGPALPLSHRAIHPAGPVPRSTRGIDQHLGHRAGQRAEHLDRAPPTPLTAARANHPAQGADPSLRPTEDIAWPSA